MDAATKARLRQSLVHGVPPLTLDECRELWHLATGERIDGRTRCTRCGGTGVIQVPIQFKTRPVVCKTFAWEERECDRCNGTGYQTKTE